jgi:hypothetical protein
VTTAADRQHPHRASVYSIRIRSDQRVVSVIYSSSSNRSDGSSSSNSSSSSRNGRNSRDSSDTEYHGATALFGTPQARSSSSVITQQQQQHPTAAATRGSDIRSIPQRFRAESYEFQSLQTPKFTKFPRVQSSRTRFARPRTLKGSLRSPLGLASLAPTTPTARCARPNTHTARYARRSSLRSPRLQI